MIRITTNKEMFMQYNQIERLKNDSRELDNYIYRLKKKGKNNLISKLKRKQQFLQQAIAECDEVFSIQTA
tara:strand:+ start:859 stop:1068 length:210 start_codon:yes stop_codon:yes gene_type:complete